MGQASRQSEIRSSVKPCQTIGPFLTSYGRSCPSHLNAIANNMHTQNPTPITFNALHQFLLLFTHASSNTVDSVSRMFCSTEEGEVEDGWIIEQFERFWR